MPALPAWPATIRTAASTRFSSKRSAAPPPTSVRDARDAPRRDSACDSGRSATTRCARQPELPEIRRLDLAETVLSLKAAGVRHLASFRWMDSPDEKSLARAEQLLADLGALDPYR